MEKIKAYIGIDPGISKSKPGAMALLIKDGRYHLHDWTSELSAVNCLKNWQYNFDVEAQLEEIVSGTSATLYPNNKLSANYGFYRGALLALSIPFKTATPRSWQSRVFIPSPKEDTTQRAFETVHFYFNGLRDHIKYAAKHSGRADAILIAYDLKRRSNVKSLMKRTMING